MGTFSRLRYVIAANVNSLIEKAEDPEKLLRALIREMEDASDEARMASADLLAEQQHLDRLESELASQSEQWQSRAENAVVEQRDDLARAALQARAEIETRHASVKQEQSTIRDRVSQMESDMVTLKSKLAEAKLKLKTLSTRSTRTSGAANPAREVLSPSEKRIRKAMGRFDRLETQVENLEARVRSYEFGGPSPRVWDSKDQPADPAVEEELARLKQRIEGQTEISAEETSDTGVAG
jgi:phage shock protein A